MEIGIKEAKNNLSSLIEQARAGERVFVTNRGERMVELVPVPDSQAPDCGLGWLKGKSQLPKGFGTAKWKKSVFFQHPKSPRGHSGLFVRYPPKSEA